MQKISLTSSIIILEDLTKYQTNKIQNLDFEKNCQNDLKAVSSPPVSPAMCSLTSKRPPGYKLGQMQLSHDYFEYNIQMC